MAEDSPEHGGRLRTASLPRHRDLEFRLEPTSQERRAVAERLEIIDIKKLRFEGRLIPEGRADWRLEGWLGATVVQPCVVTLDPVTTRIDETVTRRFLADAPAAPGGGEVEMPQDESEEALSDEISLDAVMLEALSLALPAYPRRDGAEMERSEFTEPGKTPLSDEDVRPFAGLKALRDRPPDGGKEE